MVLPGMKYSADHNSELNHTESKMAELLNCPTLVQLEEEVEYIKVSLEQNKRCAI